MRKSLLIWTRTAAMLLLATLFANTALAETTLTLSGGNGTKTDPYQISSVADWNTLADYIDNCTDVKCCEDMFFQLTTDIGSEQDPIKTVLGSQKKVSDEKVFRRFAGTFDGNGNTIYVELKSNDLSSTKLLDNKYCAPFAYVQTATIKNLHVTGTITTKGQFASGLVGSTGPFLNKSTDDQTEGECTIDNCHVSVTIDNQLTSGNGNHGGFIGIAEGSAHITNSWFDGTFSGKNYKYSAGFIGMNKGKNTKLTKCLFNPQPFANTLNTTGSCEFVHNMDQFEADAVLTEAYWVTHFGEPDKTQGQKVVTELTEAIQDAINAASESQDFYVKTLGENDVPDRKTYYIVMHHPTWIDLKNALETGNDFLLNGSLEAGAYDEPIVIPEGKTVKLTLKDNSTLDRGLAEAPAQADGYVIMVEEGASLTIEGGTITGGNNTTHGGGIYNAGTLNLIGTTVTGNYSIGNGGGIYNAGALTIDGATITGNVCINPYGQTATIGAGVFVADNSTFSVKGNVQINNNNCKNYNKDTTFKLASSNLYLDGTSVISIAGPLKESSIISVGGTDDVVASFSDLEKVGDLNALSNSFKQDGNADMKAYVDGVNKQVRWNTSGKTPLSAIPGLTDFLKDYLEYSEVMYNGSAFEPKFTEEEIECKGSIGPWTDGDIISGYFKISGYSNNTDAGTAYVIISAIADDEIVGLGDNPVIGSTTIPFTIYRRPITITANAQTVSYGGSIQQEVANVNVSNTDDLVSGHSLTAVTLEASDVDLDVPGTITPTAAVIMDGETDMTANYDFTFKPGELTMTPKPITIKAIDQTVTYSETIQQGTDYVIISNTKTEEETEDNTEDNTEENTDISTENTTENPLVGNQKLTAITLTASEGADVETPGTITPSAAIIKDGETDMTKYYVITYETGTLTVSPLSGVVVTITGHNGGFEYNNEEHAIKGYDVVAISSELYTEADFTFSGTAEIRETAAGTYFMGLTKDDFENINTNFSVTFDVTDGYMTIDNHIAALADIADNTATITSLVEHNFCLADVTLAGRTFYKDGDWNTICLPFDLTIAGSPLAGADVRELSSASLANGTLTLNFTEEGAVTALKAGVPYIIKWANGSNISEPVLEGTNFSTELKDKAIDLGDGKSVIFKGTYAPITYTSEDKSVLLVGAESTLYYPEAGAYTNAQRAYFQLEGLEVGTVESNAIGFRFGDATGIPNLNDLKDLKDLNVLNAIYYDLSGRRINGQPTEAGIYIVNGRKVVIK